jgi:hypothetical protein
VSFLPAGDAVEPNAKITATFDRAMDEGSITDNFTLETGLSNNAPGTPVAGDVSYDAGTKTATFTPDSRLTLTVGYKAILTTGITSADGKALESERTLEFRVRDGDWNNPQKIGTIGRVDLIDLAVSQNGDAIVVWYGAPAFQGNWSRLAASATNWSIPLPLDSARTLASRLTVGMDPAGNAFVAYAARRSNTSDPNDLYGSQLLQGSSIWVAGQLLDTSPISNLSPLAVNASGDAVVVWTKNESGDAAMNASRVVSGDWQPDEAVAQDRDSIYGQPRASLNSSGLAAAVWDLTSTGHVFTARSSAVSWGPRPAKQLDNTGEASLPDIAVDDAGNRMAVWRDETNSNGEPTEIKYARYVADPGAWLDTIGRVDTTGSTNFYVRVAADGEGNTHVIWQEAKSRIRARVWRIGTGSFNAVDELTPSSDERVRYPEIALEPLGTGLAVWYREDGTIWSGRYRFGSDWGASPVDTLDNVPTGPSTSGRSPRIRIRPDGTAVAIWATETDVFGATFE